MKKSPRPAVIAATLLLPVALVLGGCSLIPGGGLPGIPGGGSGEVDDETVEGIIEGSSGEDLDVELNALPEGFPADRVPLVDGEIVVGFAIPGSDSDPKDGWQVTLKVANEATAASAEDLLRDAGYSNDSVIGWEKDDLLVVVSWAQDGGAWQVSYIVAEQ